MADEAAEVIAHRARRYGQLMSTLEDAVDDGRSVFDTLRHEIGSPHTTSSTVPILLDLGQYFHVMRTYARRLKATVLRNWTIIIRRFVRTNHSLMGGLRRVYPTGE